MAKHSETALRELRESLPIVELLNKAFKGNSKLTGDYFKRLRLVTLSLRIADFDNRDTWEQLVGLPNSDWEYAKATVLIDVDMAARNFAELLYTYVKSILDVESQAQSINTMAQLSHEFTTLKNQLEALIQKTEDRFIGPGEQISEIQDECARIDRSVVALQGPGKASEYSEWRLNELDATVADFRSQMDEIRKQQSSLLMLVSNFGSRTTPSTPEQIE